jgi:hypothetical protein
MFNLMTVAVAVLVPSLVLACPACTNTQEQNRVAYLVTTALLTLLPVGMIGTLIGWLISESRKANQETQAPANVNPLPVPAPSQHV